jgi:hypothetical protein
VEHFNEIEFTDDPDRSRNDYVRGNYPAYYGCKEPWPDRDAAIGL